MIKTHFIIIVFALSLIHLCYYFFSFLFFSCRCFVMGSLAQQTLQKKIVFIIKISFNLHLIIFLILLLLLILFSELEYGLLLVLLQLFSLALVLQLSFALLLTLLSVILSAGWSLTASLLASYSLAKMCSSLIY